MKAYLNQVATAVPEHESHRYFVDRLPDLVPREWGDKLRGAVAELGIERRYSVLPNLMDMERPDPFYEAGKFPSTAERMQVYQREALPLAERAIQALNLKSFSEITHLILTSCTGFYAPGLDIDIVQKFGLSPTTERTLVGYMGCYAAITGLKLARHIVRSEPKAKVLLLNLELCSLHWRQTLSFDQIISFLLFADGCAASVVSAEPRGLSLDSFHSGVLPESLDLMQWTISDQGFYMKLDSRIPLALRVALEEFKALQGEAFQAMKLWAIHPGGRSILDAAEDELQLPSSALAYSRGVLRDFGNMSSPTVMFVLKRILEDPQAKGAGAAMAFGPGLTLESFNFEKCA